MSHQAAGLRLLVFSGLVAVVACKAPGGPRSVRDPSFFPGGAPRSDVGADAAISANAGPLRCVPARGQPLPARVNAVSAEAVTAKDQTIFTADLFGLFKSHCGGCHVDTRLGELQASPRTFADVVDRKVIDAIKSDDPAKFMPPLAGGGKPFSQRQAGDPVVELASLLELWLGQGRPRDAFTLPSEQKEGVSPFLLTEAAGERMTNLGDCVVEGGLVGMQERQMEDLDAFFARATELPENLEDTDLFTLDGETLAKTRVVPFAPTYPLWSDDAAKIRHIRVPHGQAVRFDKATQQFDIPANTRFYKTFLKEVIDRAGRKSYRKIETRLILARPDRKKPDGTVEVTALFGTYLWNDDETQARLLRDPLRNGRPFRDRLITYFTDEPKVQEVIDSKPRNLTLALEEEHTGLLRRYAVPSSERCLQCHMGSPSGSFVLGFIPLQIARRPAGASGVTEPVAEDELNQLQRLIDYGVIAGISAPADVLPLERSQGDRKPRNEHELKAQAYILGNCASCHNPRGFPSVKSPELREVLDLLPSASGGIFQFPLDRMSPLRKRGPELGIPMPYITPSLREYPVGAAATPNWTPKWTDCGDRSLGGQNRWALCATRYSGSGAGEKLHVDAPWRSLIYRNVDTPYTYADDFVVFPRMPMHAPGFDCRAPRIMGDWMVSIPAVRKEPSTFEDAVPLAENTRTRINVPVDRNPQPYEEVKPGAQGYDEAVAAAKVRLERYHTGGRYEFCPDTTDVVDPKVLRVERLVPPADNVLDPKDPTRILMPKVGVPLRPHWAVTDLTDAAGDWFPRRPDWEDVIGKGKGDDPSLPRAARAQQNLLAAVFKGGGPTPGVTLTRELRELALAETPFGLWDAKPGCDFSGIPKVSDFPDDRRPQWMKDRANLAADAPVYTLSPGAAVYSTVCFNCHGPQADSKGLLGEAIMLMTGGEARVANFKDGLFGPLDHPGANRARVYGSAATELGVTADDLGARYLAWMALGGTKRELPRALLNIVAATRVFGQPRKGVSLQGSANMLELARALCRGLLPAGGNPATSKFFPARTFDLAAAGLIVGNGDAAMWQQLCNLGNRMVVRVPFVETWDSETGFRKPLELYELRSLYWADAYPADAPVLDHRGRVVNGVRPDNLFPVCMRKPADPAQLALADGYRAMFPAGGAGGPLVPYCPKELFEPDPNRWLFAYERDEEGNVSLLDVEKWALRGAVNAGLAVFLYLDQVERGLAKPKPPFNRCEELRK